MTRPFKTVSSAIFGLLLVVVTLPSGGCEGFQPEMFPVGDTITLHSLARAEHIGEWSAFDFITPRMVVVERPKDPNEDQFDFDMAFSEEAGEFVVLPAGLFESFDIDPGIAPIEAGVTFEELAEAPREGFVTDEPVPVSEGAVYAVRTRQQGTCTRYAKFEVLDLDPDGILEFRFLRNNLCNDRTLIAPDDD